MYLCSYFFFKQKTAYELRISDWSSDVCSSDLAGDHLAAVEVINDGFLVALGDLEGTPQAGAARHQAEHQARLFRRAAIAMRPDAEAARTAERRVGKECDSTCRYRRSP